MPGSPSVTSRITSPSRARASWHEGRSPASISRRARTTRSSTVMGRTVAPPSPFLTGRQVTVESPRQSRERGSMTDDLHRGTYMADLLLHALGSNLDKPCVYLGDQVLTAREVRDEMSRYTQALTGLGLGRGSTMSVLAPNRPEVLFNMGANNLVGCRTTPLHPLGSEDDHAYVIDDAGIETLVYDPVFEERAVALRDR